MRQTGDWGLKADPFWAPAGDCGPAQEMEGVVLVDSRHPLAALKQANRAGKLSGR